MATARLKRHDTKAREFLLTSGGRPLDLTGATLVRLLARPRVAASATPAISAVCVVDVTPTTGRVAWLPTAPEVATADVFNAEFEVTWSDGTVETVPTPGYVTLVIEPDLGP